MRNLLIDLLPGSGIEARLPGGGWQAVPASFDDLPPQLDQAVEYRDLSQDD